MTDGTVKVRNLSKRFIVVEGDDGSNYTVSTRSTVGPKAHVGDRVSFDNDPDETKGKRGKNIRIADYA